jgi:hypothetical protein
MIGNAANAASSHGETNAREPSASIGYDLSLLIAGVTVPFPFGPAAREDL